MLPGCFSKVRGLSNGISLACHYSGERLSEVVFPVFSGIERVYIDSCAQSLQRDVCTPRISESDFFSFFRKIFEGCCVEQCGGVALDGGFACGYKV